jgi:hypothetical protein
MRLRSGALINEYGRLALPVALTREERNAWYIPEIDVQPGGVCICRWPGWGYTRAELDDKIRELLDAFFTARLTARLPQSDYYWRATNNADEIKLIKRGQLHPSRNHADGMAERGLSVADHLGYTMLGYRYAYRVRGRVIGVGSDGEPILDIATLQPLDRAPRPIQDVERREGEQRRATLRAILAEIGWSEEQYRASLWAYAVPAEEYYAECVED